MDAITFILIAVLVLAVAVAAVVLVGSRRRARLRERFGPEYDRVVTSGETREEAEAELRGRLEERDKLDVRSPTESERAAYQEQWQQVQAEFVEQPDTALAHADRLVEQLMRDCGYPVDEFEHQAGLLSVDLPEVVTRYRDGHEVFERTGDGEVSTEGLREALVAYRDVFEALVGRSADEPAKEKETSR